MDWRCNPSPTEKRKKGRKKERERERRKKKKERKEGRKEDAEQLIQETDLKVPVWRWGEGQQEPEAWWHQ
jgi:hypothetical protein